MKVIPSLLNLAFGLLRCLGFLKYFLRHGIDINDVMSGLWKIVGTGYLAVEGLLERIYP